MNDAWVGCVDLGITLIRAFRYEFVEYPDADYAKFEDRRSVSGGVIRVGDVIAAFMSSAQKWKMVY